MGRIGESDVVSRACVHKCVATIRCTHGGDASMMEQKGLWYPRYLHRGMEIREKTTAEYGYRKNSKRRGNFADFRFSQIK